MNKIIFFLASMMVMTWATPALAQLSYGEQCRFYNIDKTVKAKLGEGEDAAYQQNTIKAFWPVMLNGKECPKLQEAICKWLTDKDDIKMDQAIEYTLYTDIENVPFGDNGPYQILDSFKDLEASYSSTINTIELKTLGKRFAVFHLLSYMYYAGAAHGSYVHNYITYDTELDKIVTLEDVLIDPELIRPHILESINLKYDYSEEDLFLPEDGIIKIPSVFYFEEGFLHLCYQVYEIASFAQGDIDVPLFYPNDPSAPEYLTPYGKILMEESSEEEPW